MKKWIKGISSMLLALTLVFGNAVSVDAAVTTIRSFPTQSTSGYSTGYTRGMQVMLMNYNTTTRSLIWNSGGSDGAFGSASANAVKTFQSTSGISADGICGPNTWKYLDMSIAQNSSTSTYLFYKGKTPYYSTNMMRQTISSRQWYCHSKTNGGTAAWVSVGK